jgi:hypothetical protein
LCGALVPNHRSGETKLSRHCPRDGHGLARHGQTSPSENTTFDGTCTYTNCLSLETFADYVRIDLSARTPGLAQRTQTQRTAASCANYYALSAPMTPAPP